MTTPPICIRCGNPEATVTVCCNKGFRDSSTVFHCDDCDEAFSLRDVEYMIESWGAILPWVRQHPLYQPEK